MFRKRFFRPRGRDFGPSPHPMLQRANELMAIGDYTGAARAFEELAQAAMGRNGPAAPHLYIQAGRARIQAGQVPTGVVHIKQALTLFAGRGEWLKFCRNQRRVVAELHGLGFETEANTLAAFLSDEIPAGLEEAADVTRDVTHDGTRQVGRHRAILPPKCQGCGAPLRSDEVDWVDDMTAECPFCGSIARSQ